MPRDERFDGDLPVEQQPEGPAQSPEDAEAALTEAYGLAFAQGIEENPEVQDLLVQDEEVEGESPPSRGFWRSLGDNIDSLFDLGGPAGVQLSPDAQRAMVRGVTRAVDETVEFAVEDIGGNFLQNTATGKLIRGVLYDEEEEAFFQDWFEARSTTETALLGDAFRDNHLKYDNDTLAVHMLEGITQFSVGFVGLGKVKGLAGAATLGGRLGRAALRGGLVDFAMFDPHEQRLADLIEAYPALSNPITRFLESDLADTAMEGRIKNLLEGLVIGTTIDGFIESLRGVRTWRAARAGDVDPSDVIAQLQESKVKAREAVETPPPADDVVRAVTQPDGTAAIRANVETGVQEVSGGRGLKIETPDGTLKASPVEGTKDFRVTAAHTARAGEGIGTKLYAQLGEEVQRRGGRLLSDTAGNRSEAADRFWRGLVEKGRASFDEVANEFTYIAKEIDDAAVPTASLGDAQVQAESINWQARRARLPDGAEGVRGEAELWQALADKLETTVDLESILRVAEGTDIPLRYVSEPREIKAAVEAISDMLGPRVKETISQRTVEQLADEMFHGIPVDQVLDWGRRTFGETADLAPRMVALRAYMINHVKTVRQMAKMFDHAPDNARLATQLGRAMDTMYSLYADVSGTGSNVGRALESQKVDVGALRHLPPELKEAATLADEFTAARRAYQATLQTGDSEAIKAALQVLDDLGEKMSTVVGSERPKNKADLARTFDRDARRQAKAKEASVGGETVEPKPDQLPGALRWYDDALEKLNKQVDSGRAQRIDEIPRENPATHRSFAGMTREEIRQQARMIFMQEDIDVNAVMGLIMAPKRKFRPGARDWQQKALSARIALMLSGPVTHMTNSINNLAFMHLRGLEQWWSGVSPRARAKLTAGGSTAREMRTSGFDLVAGYWMGLGEAWRAAKQSFKIGDNMLKPGSARDGLRDLQMVGPEGKAFGALTRLQLLPGRMLISADEFAQQMSYRSNVRMQLLRQARREAVSDVGQFVTDHMKFAFTDDGRGTIANALRFSEEVTFKTPLNPKSTTQAISNAAQDNAVVRFIFPFIRTPANLIRRGYQRTPLAAKWSKEITAELAAGGDRAAVAMAQIEIGSALLATASIMAWNGLATGRGPSDPDLRRQWRSMGNKPYSIRMPGTGVSVSYRRADPIMMFVGAVADITSVAGEIKDGQISQDEVLGALLSAATVNLGNKTYLQGAAGIMEALSSGDPQAWERALTEAGMSFTPAILRQLTFDDMEREINDLTDRVMGGAPGFSQMREPRRNLFGQKVLKAPGSDLQQFNPFTVSFMSEEDREFNERIFEMGRAFAMPAKKMRVGSAEIDLTLRGRWTGPDTPQAQRNQSPYDRYMELMGTKKIGGQTLEEALRELVGSEEFATAEKHGTVQEGGEAYILIARQLTMYQRVAFAGMIQEYPGIIAERARLNILGGGEKVGATDLIEQAQQ